MAKDNSDIANSIAAMVTEWIDGGKRLDTDWRPGLAEIIRRRLDRQPPVDPYQLDKERRERLQLDRDLALAGNIAANGRWGVLAMVAICIANGQIRIAWAWGFLLFLAYVFEQFPHPDTRRILALCLGVNGLALLIWTWWTL